MSTRARRAFAVSVVTVTALVVLAGTEPAVADCVAPPPLEQAIAEAPIAFVGTVVDVRDRTIAHFRVEEVWAGPALVEVTVQGGPGGGAMTSVDRVFEPGERYLVLPYADGAGLHDTSCSSTQVWRQDLTQLRPADARTVDHTGETSEPGPPDGSRSPLPWLVAAVIAGGLAIVAGLTWGFARRTR